MTNRTGEALRTVRPAGPLTLRVRSGGRVSRRFIRRNPSGFVAIVVVAVLVLFALTAPVLAPHEPDRLLNDGRLVPPLGRTADGDRLWLGGDQLGRDMLARAMYGARISLGIAIVGVLGSSLLGAVVGAIGAYAGGGIDSVIQRMVDTLLILPVLITAMVLTTMLGNGWFNIVLAIWLVQTPRMARVVRGEVLTIKERPYVEAARSIGGDGKRILIRHIAPNIAPIVLVVGTIDISAAILLEGGLSFLGFGVAPPTSSWGLMIREGQTYMTRDVHMLLVPGVMISAAVLAFSIVGDTLRDALDPRLRNG